MTESELRIARNDVLHVLYHARASAMAAPSRSSVQSILFLAATLAPLVHIKWNYAFTSNAYGPFNRAVYLSADSLAVQGQIQTLDARLFRTDTLRSQYEITAAGEVTVKRLLLLESEKVRSTWIRHLVEALSAYDFSIINKIAKAEPTLVQMRQLNQSGIIPLGGDENLSLELLSAIVSILNADYNIDLQRSEGKVVTFLDFISADIARPLVYDLSPTEATI